MTDPHPAALTPEQMARRLEELADNPSANGFVPVHPDTLRQAAAAIRSPDAPAERYGCHCDLESMDEGYEPDGCVIDEGRPQDCIYSRCGDKWKCEYWRPIKATETGYAL